MSLRLSGFVEEIDLKARQIFLIMTSQQKNKRATQTGRKTRECTQCVFVERSETQTYPPNCVLM